MNNEGLKGFGASEIENIFLDALEIPQGRDREAFLFDACEGDQAARDAVEALLRDHEAATNLFQQSALHLPFSEGDDSSGEVLEIGSSVGPYRICKTLGEGGGGVVYEAEQLVPLRRRVALKVLKTGTDADRFVALFEAERQTLALMEHPNIARVIDAGATSDGRPYFAMDLVHGTKITDFCTEDALPVRDRLKLIRQVCAAVQHAHNKGVIHRDIKPSNILVSLVDGIAVPKVIDFGIARATTLQPERRDASVSRHQWIGTPAYMSPEQFAEDVDIDTRSDVYSLGAVLYELLAGRPAFDNAALMKLSPEEMRFRVCHDAQPPLSMPTAGVRALERNELECVVRKAMEKDRESRYPTMEALSADIERILHGEPVDAHAPSRVYRLKKLLSRNKLASAMVAAAAITLAGGFTTSTLLFFRAHTAELEQLRLRTEAEEREHITKAAILLMQGKTAEADAELHRFGSVLTQPSLEATNVFRKLAEWSAMKGNWKRSAELWLALSRVNRFDDSDMTDNATRDLLPVAPTLLTIQDFERYYKFQHMLANRLSRTTNPIAAEQVLKICLQAPTGRDVMAALAPMAKVAADSLAERAETAPQNMLEAWRCIALALWNYRTQDYGQAIDWCDRAVLWQDNDHARIAYAHIIRAMSEGELGEQHRADTDLAAAKSIMDLAFNDPQEYQQGGYWHDWLTVRILFDEATGLSPARDYLMASITEHSGA